MLTDSEKYVLRQEFKEFNNGDVIMLLAWLSSLPKEEQLYLADIVKYEPLDAPVSPDVSTVLKG